LADYYGLYEPYADFPVFRIGKLGGGSIANMDKYKAKTEFFHSEKNIKTFFEDF